MVKKSNVKKRKMRPIFIVFCEGETEVEYINLLRKKYRLPIKIETKILGSSINEPLINKHKKSYKTTSSDDVRIFLMYDADVTGVLDNLKKIKETLLISKPCIEIWFLAHFNKCFNSELSSSDCIKKLSDIEGWSNYKKGNLEVKQKELLWENRLVATNNMMNKTEKDNNYSKIYLLINLLENEKNKT